MTIRTMGIPESSTPLTISPGYALNAAPQAIEHHLKTLRRRRAALDRAISRYEALLAERLAQVEAGTWPPPRTETS